MKPTTINNNKSGMSGFEVIIILLLAAFVWFAQVIYTPIGIAVGLKSDPGFETPLIVFDGQPPKNKFAKSVYTFVIKTDLRIRFKYIIFSNVNDNTIIFNKPK